MKQSICKSFLQPLVICLLAFGFSGCDGKSSEPQQSSDESEVQIYANGDIITMNPAQPKATAIAIKDGKILVVGDLPAVKKAAGDHYEYYDLEGHTMVPGFIETHDHMMQHGATMQMPDVTPFTQPTLKQALQTLSTLQPDKDGWIKAWAVDQTLYEEKRGPTIQELDALFPDTPVLIWHLSGHGAYANSKALAVAGIDKQTSAPEGGEFVKDENGEFTGYLKGMPAWMAVSSIPAVTLDVVVDSGKFRASKGFTTVSELAIMHSNMLQLLEEATSDENFPVRIMAGLFVTMPGFEEVAKQARNYETGLFKVKFVKTWTDGSTQGGTGYFTEPFHNHGFDTRKGARGTQEKFNEEVTKMLQLGFAPAIHANGDGAMDLALNAIEYARKKTGNTKIRPHLIHCQYVRPDQFDRISEMGNIGMTFMTPHVYYWGDMHRDVFIGPERAANISALKTAIEKGIDYAIHNDAPVTPPDAMHSMWVAVKRLTSSGKLLGAEQRITAEQALAGYTREAAAVFGMEDEIGTLEVGKYADFVVLEKNPLQVELDHIKDIKIIATVMGGRVTHLMPESFYSP
jgi:predicted amidohydrolase YtcJ